jgi:hypothetical protein
MARRCVVGVKGFAGGWERLKENEIVCPTGAHSIVQIN